MAHINKVVLSVNAPGDLICVDLFRRPDGSYGFEEYRRDPEDGQGWYPVGQQASQVFDTQSDALNAALAAIHWLSDAIPDQDGVSRRDDP